MISYKLVPEVVGINFYLDSAALILNEGLNKMVCHRDRGGYPHALRIVGANIAVHAHAARCPIAHCLFRDANCDLELRPAAPHRGFELRPVYSNSLVLRDAERTKHHLR